MSILEFPPVKNANPEGLLAIGGDLEVDSLKLAYSQGIFPWPMQNYPLLWFAPPQRAILEFKRLHVPKRLARTLKSSPLHYAIDLNFPEVIRQCALGSTRASRGTWISPAMRSAYVELHRAGIAHSFECYEQERLVGGLYGVGLGGMFAAESMFFLKSGASKAALLFTCAELQARGASWMDIQVLSPLLQGFGAHEIPREGFMKKLELALKENNLF